MTKALVVGATGVVGRELVNELCQDKSVEQVIVLARRELSVQHKKLKCHVVDFNQPDTWQQLVNADSVYCALGTTLKQAGSKEAQRRIDLELPLAIASAAKKNGVNQFALVSSVGANANSNSFYLATKGQLEQQIKDLEFNKLTIVKPSVIKGVRPEFRLGEHVGIWLLSLFKWLPIINRYRPITGNMVAKGLIYWHSVSNDKVTIKQLNELFV
jgi:uncharacterized protein YbjT (DUF2867 family)